MAATNLYKLLIALICLGCPIAGAQKGTMFYAEELTITGFTEPSVVSVDCARVTSFVEHSQDRGENKRELRPIFDACVAHKVPYGVYDVRAETKRFRFSRTCLVYQKRPVCVLLQDLTDHFPTNLRFMFNRPKTMTIPLWLHIKSVFDWNSNNSSFRHPDATVAFDENGNADISATLATDVVVTLLNEQSIVASSYLRLSGSRQFSISLNDGHLTIKALE